MAGFAIHIEGLDALNARLNKLKQDEIDRISMHALKAGGRVFKQEIEERAPERPDLPSGTALPPGALRNDVIVTGIKGAGHMAVVQVRPGKLTMHAAHLVEYGHELVIHGKTVKQIPAQPYARPAFEAGSASALQAIADSLTKDLARVDANNEVKEDAE